MPTRANALSGPRLAEAARLVDNPERMSSDVQNETAIRRLADDLFLATDDKDWTAVRALFVDGPIAVEMKPFVPGGPATMTADDLVTGFRAGLHAGKTSHHIAANYRITIDGDSAELFAHGYAWNRVAALGAGADLWETWGNYTLLFRRERAGWRIASFAYESKLTRGNEGVRTHAPA